MSPWSTLSNESKKQKELERLLQKLLKTIITTFYPVEDMYIVLLLMRESSLTESELKEALCYDDKLLRNRIHALTRDKILKIRTAGETGEIGVGMNEIYINYEGLRNRVSLKLELLRRKVEAQDRMNGRKRMWMRKEIYFACTKCKRTFHQLYFAEIFHPKYQKFMCTFCMGPVENKEKEFPLPVGVVKFNEKFEPLYKLVQSIDDITTELKESEKFAGFSDDLEHLRNAWFTKLNLAGNGAWLNVSRRLLTRMPVRVKIITGEKMEEESQVPLKEIPPWFQSS